MSETKTYNGWKNYETWCVALWLDNEPGTYDHANELARNAFDRAGAEPRGRLTHEAAALINLAVALKGWVEDDLLPDLGASMAGDLLGAAISEVDWRAIAEHYIETNDL